MLKTKGLFLLFQAHIGPLNQEQKFCSGENGADEAQDAGKAQATVRVRSTTPARAALASSRSLLPLLFLLHGFRLKLKQQRMPDGRKIIPRTSGFVNANTAPFPSPPR